MNLKFYLHWFESILEVQIYLMFLRDANFSDRELFIFSQKSDINILIVDSIALIYTAPSGIKALIKL